MDKPIVETARRCGRPPHTLRDPRARRHRRDALRPSARRARTASRHDRGAPPRLGDLAPARLGRADHRVRARQGERTDDILNDAKVNHAHRTPPSRPRAPTPGSRIGRRERFLKAPRRRQGRGRRQKVDDILDVWFDSGSTHAFVLEDAKNFPGLAGISPAPGGPTIASCISKAPTSTAAGSTPLCSKAAPPMASPRTPAVLTHGFTLDGERPQDVASRSATPPPRRTSSSSTAPISSASGSAPVRLFGDDLRIGKEIIRLHRRQLPQAAQHASAGCIGNARPFRKMPSETRSTTATCPNSNASCCTSSSRTRPGVVREAYAELRLQAHRRGPQQRS